MMLWTILAVLPLLWLLGENIAQGVEAAPQAFIARLQGNSQGRQILQPSEL